MAAEHRIAKPVIVPVRLFRVRFDTSPPEDMQRNRAENEMETWIEAYLEKSCVIKVPWAIEVPALCAAHRMGFPQQALTSSKNTPSPSKCVLDKRSNLLAFDLPINLRQVDR
jgi:hypothetical protein